MTISERLKELRDKRELTQPDLAAAAGISVWTLRNLEQGRRDPTWAILQRLAKALKAPLGAFDGCDLAEMKDKPKRKGKK